MVKKAMVEHALSATMPVPSDAKRALSFQRVMRALNNNRGNHASQTNEARGDKRTACGAVRATAALRAFKAVKAVHAPTRVVVRFTESDHERDPKRAAIGADKEDQLPRQAAIADGDPGAPTECDFWDCGFVDAWAPNDTAWARCFGCQAAMAVRDAQVVIRTGGVCVLWHHACRERALTTI